MGKIIDFKIAKQNIENKKKEKLKNKKIKKAYDYKCIILVFAVILVITALFFLWIPQSNNPENINFIGQNYNFIL